MGSSNIHTVAGLISRCENSIMRTEHAVNETLEHEINNAVLCWLASVDEDGMPNAPSIRGKGTGRYWGQAAMSRL